MAPKKPLKPASGSKPASGNAKGSGKAGKAQPTPEDALKAELDGQKQKLEQAVAAKQSAEESRNFLQLERDSIASYWEVTRNELKEAQAALRQKDRDAERAEDRHQSEIKAYKQKVKHLLYEHQNNIEALRVGTVEAVQASVEGWSAQQAGLKEDRAVLKKQLREQKDEMLEALLQSRVNAANEVSRCQAESEAAARELAAAYDSKLAAMRDAVEAKFKAEAQAAEDAKTKHVQELVKEQSAAYEDMRAFFNDVVTNSLDLIKALKADAVELKRREAAAEALAHELATENRDLKQPLQQAQKEAEALRAKAAAHDAAVARVEFARARVAAAKKRSKELEWKNEVLEQRVEVLEGVTSRELLASLPARAQATVLA